MKRLITAALVVFCAATFAEAQTALHRTIEANAKAFVEAFNKGDATAVANMYAMNARLMPPNSDMVEGRANIRNFWQGAMTAGIKMVSLDTVAVETHGNTVIEVGRYTSTEPGADGATVSDNGKYVVVWKREGRQWKMTIDIFNTSKAVTP